MRNPDEMYFTDIVYTPASTDYTRVIEDLLKHFSSCSVCGKDLGIDDCYLMSPRQYCKECKVKLNLSSMDRGV